jgi:hypothetical protein
MRHAANEGFILTSRDIKRDILIPRYYDPRIDEELHALSATNDLRSIDSLVAAKQVQHDHGSYIPKMYYGTGPIPYVRTSDIANWEVMASPKHGIPVEVYEDYKADQDVKPGDIFFVHEGSYLIGTAAMVTTYDGPLLYQHHLAKFRVATSAPFGPYFFLAAIESPPVKRQIRSKQFTADIIDSVVGRVGEVVIPIPKDRQRLARIEGEARKAVLGRAKAREQLSRCLRSVDEWLRGEIEEDLDTVFSWQPAEVYEGKVAFLRYRTEFMAFMHPIANTKNDILLPKYYDPSIEELAGQYRPLCDLVTVGDLLADKSIRMDIGDSIGKITYGTGDIPFVRTSDLASWELKREPKKGVSEDVHSLWKEHQDVQAGDIFLIQDGTYLVGNSILLSKSDMPLLYCNGMYKLRTLRPDRLDSNLLFALLNLPFVRKQMRNKQFTRDIIDTLGNRVVELVLPIPKDAGIRKALAHGVGGLVAARDRLKYRLQTIVTEMYPPHTDMDYGPLFQLR